MVNVHTLFFLSSENFELLWKHQADGRVWHMEFNGPHVYLGFGSEHIMFILIRNKPYKQGRFKTPDKPQILKTIPIITVEKVVFVDVVGKTLREILEKYIDEISTDSTN